MPALKDCKEAGTPFFLHIVGGGEYQSYYEEMAKDLGIEEDCRFYGQVPRAEVYRVMEQMDFMISASIYECSGVSVEEAMLFGKPLVVTRSGGADSLTTPQTAMVADKGSTGALCEGIQKMLSETEGYRSFDSEKIRTYAAEHFGMKETAAQYRALYAQLVEKRK